MAFDDTKLDEELQDLLRERGYDPYADVVPSANGGPIQTELTADEFQESAKAGFDGAFELIRNDMVELLGSEFKVKPGK